MGNTPKINLYLTKSHDCSYLQGQAASTLFVDPDIEINSRIYARLSENGFRRSGSHLYRPHCKNCQQCIPLRIPVDSFRPSRGQRRIWNRNQDLQVDVVDDIGDLEYYRLYENYICSRHADGDMFPPSREQYDSFLGEHWDVTHFLTFRMDGILKAVAVSDTLENGISAIYTFYDTDETRRSLGVYGVLFQVELARKLDLPHVYLGYWVPESRKMSYKSDYKPYEIFRDGQWIQPIATE